MKLKPISTIITSFIAATISAGSASAQNPERVVPPNSISIAVGHAQTLKFPNAFDTINIASQGIVKATASTDQMMTLLGESEGETILSVFKGGQQTYSATVTITPEAGHVVRVYGGNNPDYVGYYCTTRSCGRADKELNGSRETRRTETTIIHSGNAVSYKPSPTDSEIR